MELTTAELLEKRLGYKPSEKEVKDFDELIKNVGKYIEENYIPETDEDGEPIVFD